MKRSKKGLRNFELIGEYMVQDVLLKQPFSFMASDQKGPNIVISFSKERVQKHWFMLLVHIDYVLDENT